MSSENSATNFYFSGLKSSPVVTKDDSDTLKFIIIQNDTLHTKVEQMTTEVNRLTIRVDELEADNDKLEKDKLAFRSYLKNEVIHKNLYKSLSGIFKDQLEYYKTTNYQERFLHVFTFLCFVFYAVFKTGLALILVTNITVVAVFMYSNMFDIAYKVFDERIKMVRNEIAEVNKGNNLLEQLIDDL